MHETLPVYQQIVQDYLRSIEKRRLKLGDQLPSLNKVSEIYGVSRDTAVKAFRVLLTRGVIDSRPGKGYFVSSTEVNREKQVFLFFDSFAPYKEVLYNALIKNLGTDIKVDLFFHHRNYYLFNTVISENLGRYSSYVIMPMLDKHAVEFLKGLYPRYPIYILDTGWKEIGEEVPSVCQHFEADIKDMLESAAPDLKKYKRLEMVVPEPVTESDRKITDSIRRGFRNFCVKHGIDGKMVDSLQVRKRPQTCYILHRDEHLIELIETAREKKMYPGKDFGVISFNETPLKRVVGEGITTISTDFQAMGKQMAEMIRNNETKSIRNPCRLYRRTSL